MNLVEKIQSFRSVALWMHSFSIQNDWEARHLRFKMVKMLLCDFLLQRVIGKYWSNDRQIYN